MSDPYSTSGHLTVRRDLHEHTAFVEVYELESLIWAQDDKYDIVKCHISHVNDVLKNGVPHTDDRVTTTCTWSELPEDVRDEFISQIQEAQGAILALNDES